MLRAATIDDVPLILRGIRALAEYERLAHECVATGAMLRETLFGASPVAEVVLAFHGDARGKGNFMRLFGRLHQLRGRAALDPVAQIARGTCNPGAIALVLGVSGKLARRFNFLVKQGQTARSNEIGVGADRNFREFRKPLLIVLFLDKSPAHIQFRLD